MASEVPVNVGVESFESEVFSKELGASGAVVSFELDEEEPLLPGNDDFPAKVSTGTIKNRKPKVDNKNVDL